MIRSLFPFLIALLLLSCTSQEAPRTEPPPIRGLWLTNVVSEAMFSHDSLQQVVTHCEAWGINTIFVVVWNRGFTLYPSQVMEDLTGYAIDTAFAGRDPLQELIDLAHPKGIAVHAWMEFGFAEAYQEEGKHLLADRPHWRAIGPDGQQVVKNDFSWMNAFHPEVQGLMIDLAIELTIHYDIDGIQGDDRLPACPSLAGYDDWTIDLYQKSHEGADPPTDYRDSAWVQWRADLLSDFMQTFHDTLKSIRPDLAISSAPSIYPWSKEEYLQDWPRWVDSGWVDFVCPQVYRYELERYEGELKKIVGDQIAPHNHSRLFPGILLRVGDYFASDSLLTQMIQANRTHGIQGEVFFYYEGMKKHNAYFRNGEKLK